MIRTSKEPPPRIRRTARGLFAWGLLACSLLIALSIAAVVLPRRSGNRPLPDSANGQAAPANQAGAEPALKATADSRKSEPARSAASLASGVPPVPAGPERALLESVHSFVAEHPGDLIRALDKAELDAALKQTVELRRSLSDTEAKMRAELSGPAQAGVFQIGGEIKHREENQLIVWGYAIPQNADSRQLGSHMQEANILVDAPKIEGITGGVRYDGTHSYVRESSGTNGFGASVPVSVYGAIPREVSDHQDALRLRLTALTDAARSLGLVYQRTRRAVLGASENCGEQSDAAGLAVRAIDALVGTTIDEGQFSKPDLNWKNRRILLDEGTSLPRRGTQCFERGFAQAATVLGFLDSNLVASWFTRIYAGKTLAPYLPETVTPFLQSVEAIEQPEGIEGLMNVLTNKEHLAASGLSNRYGISMLQSATCPELVQVAFRPLDSGSAWAEVVVLATWNGKRTSLLAVTFHPRSAGTTRGSPYLDLESNSRDPMGVNWPR